MLQLDHDSVNALKIKEALSLEHILPEHAPGDPLGQVRVEHNGLGAEHVFVHNHRRAHGLDPRSLNIAIEVDSNVGVKESVAAGLGVSFVSKWSIEHKLRSGIIKAVPIRDLVFKRWFYLVLDKARAPSPLCASFKQFLANHIKSIRCFDFRVPNS
jgi:DNA-binding transcriptional LysR family regulator